MIKLFPWILLFACLGLAGCNPDNAPWAAAAPPPATSATVNPPAPAPAPAAPVVLVMPPKIAAAAPTKPFAFDSASVSSGATGCEFTGLQLPPSTRVFAAGAYGGGKQDFQIDSSGHEATRMDVAVNQPNAPVVLMLGSYEPTVWSIGWTPGTRILAVLVGGYHRQLVTGLPANVPVLVSTHDNHGSCGFSYVSIDRASALNPVARRLFGRPVDMLYPARGGKVVVGLPLSGASLVTDGRARSPASFRLPNSQLAGPAGLEQAVRDGFLRAADSSDAAAWAAAMRSRSPGHGDVPPIAGGAPPPRMATIFRGYVVLKAYTFPPGLYGANSATFFVPRGVPRPTGQMGHSTVYDFNTMGCAGVACGRH